MGPVLKQTAKDRHFISSSITISGSLIGNCIKEPYIKDLESQLMP